MSLLKKDKKKPLKIHAGGGAGGQISAKRPQQVEKLPPCVDTCASGTDIRKWIGTIAQRQKTGFDEETAFREAWQILVETNPFPSVMGRVCPHPCEHNCTRSATDGAVAVNALERFIGDWALEKALPLPRLEENKKAESIGVIGSGPAGLSFAFQMARRGYPVTVYESQDHAGGMLFYGIPSYRLPPDVLDAEVKRIADVGVDIKLNTQVGRDVTVEELNKRHSVVFLAIGAHQGKPLRIPGEEGPGVWSGVDYLNRVNRGEKVNLGRNVAVIGGGDTAIDAARVARRAGANVTLVYRRTRKEMPAIESEVEAALKEDVRLEFLLAPVEMKRDGEKLRSMVVQRMELGEPDQSGRRRPVPIVGSEFEIPIDAVIAAVSQVPDWDPLEAIKPKSGWLEPDATGKIEDHLWAGGDVLGLGIASTAIAHGRRAAEVVHAKLRSQPPPTHANPPPIALDQIKHDYYDRKPRADRASLPVQEWLRDAEREIDLGITKEQFLEEVSRCLSCGLCFGCERCWMYCTPACFTKVVEPKPGLYYTVRTDTCDGCGKCADACPCGFLVMA